MPVIPDAPAEAGDKGPRGSGARAGPPSESAPGAAVRPLLRSPGFRPGAINPWGNRPLTVDATRVSPILNNRGNIQTGRLPDRCVSLLFLGAGRIGRMHADNLGPATRAASSALRSPPFTMWRRPRRASRRQAPRAGSPEHGGCGAVWRCRLRCWIASFSTTDTHGRPDRGGGGPGQGDPLRKADRPVDRAGRGLPRKESPGPNVPLMVGFKPPLRTRPIGRSATRRRPARSAPSSR